MTTRRIRSTGLILLLIAAPTYAQQRVDFTRDIKPILSDNCYACHGPDESQRQGGDPDTGGLRLDLKEAAFADLGGYQAIVAGEPEKSALIRRILSTDPDEVMPPATHRKRLSKSQKKLLVDWVQQGAEWSQHWAYVPPSAGVKPDDDTGTNWIDGFIRAKLKERGVTGSPQADKHILLRRVYFDLIGLPPKPEELDAFLADDSDTAWETVVDRLLRSPHFGERLAIYWLDLVRYADSVGYHGDQLVSISPYRDYVINAFNSNMPFDQFTREQLAGDLLPDPTQNQLIASGYNRLGMMSAEGGVQDKEYLAKYAADRVRNASGVWMGSTLGCAECHDHKFDPFTTKDFYRFAAFFADIKEKGLYSGAHASGKWGPAIDVPDDELPELLKPVDADITALQTVLQTPTDALAAAQKQWEVDTGNKTTVWQVLDSPQATGLAGVVLKYLPEQKSILASGDGAETNTYTITASTALKDITGFRLEVLPHDSLPAKGPGRAGNGNFVLSEFQAFLDDQPVTLQHASASHEQADGKNNPFNGWKAAAVIDDDKQGANWGWAILPQAGKANEWVVETAKAVGDGSEQPLRIELRQNHDNPGHTLGHFRLSVTTSPRPLTADPNKKLPPNIRDILTIAEQQRTAAQAQELATYYRSIAPALEATRKQLAAKQNEREQLVQQHTRATLITVAVTPRQMRVLPRGNWMDDNGEVVTPAIPAFLGNVKPDKPDAIANRLHLAGWLTSRDNPLTARVFVNRLWKLYFGSGLSSVLDDVGAQGEPPTHPELLDALSVEFVESGWDIKHMIKLIVMSSTYRQSSLMRKDLEQIDPYNRLRARQSRYRFDAELVRDNALSVSGLLVHQIGGRSVKPYQPAGLYRHLNFPAREYQHDTGMAQYRRGLYTHWQRQFLHPAMKSFDAPAREECTAQRPRSNTPLAALVLLNDPSYVEAARIFAERAITANPSTDERLNWIYRRAFSREPQSDEVGVLKSLLTQQLERFKADPDAAAKLLDTGLTKSDSAVGRIELAAWTSIARAVFNTHEFITRN